MLSEVSQRNINSVGYRLYVESKKAELGKTESRMMLTRGWGWQNCGMLIKGTNMRLVEKQVWESTARHRDYSQNTV